MSLQRADVVSSNLEMTVNATTASFQITDGNQEWVTDDLTVVDGQQKIAPSAHQTISTKSAADTPANWYYKYGTSETDGTGSGDPIALSSLDGFVYKQDFYFKAASDIGGVMLDSISILDSDGIGNVTNGLTVLFAGADGTCEYNFSRDIGFVPHTLLLDHVGPIDDQIDEDHPYGTQIISAYVYIDGNNSEVTSSNLENLKGKISFGFTTYTPSKNIYLQSKVNSFGDNNAKMYAYAFGYDELNDKNYENAPFPGVEMSLYRDTYYDEDQGQDVKVYQTALDIDGYDKIIYSRINPETSLVWNQTVDITDIQYEKVAVLSDDVIHGGADDNKYDFINWANLPGYSVRFKKNSTDLTNYAVVPIEQGGSIGLDKLPADPKIFGYTFESWTVNGADITKEALAVKTWSGDGEVIGRFSKDETMTIRFEAKDFWKADGTYKANIYMWKNYSDGDLLNNNSYPGLEMTYLTYLGEPKDCAYYEAELPITATGFQIVRVNASDGSIPSAGNRYRTSDIVPNKSTMDGKVLWLSETPSGQYEWVGDHYMENYYDVAGWANYPIHTIQFKVDDNVIGTLYAPDGDVFESGSVIPTATLKYGYEFTSWQLDGVDISTSALSSKTWDDDAVITARYTKEETYTIYFEAQNFWKADGGYYGASIHVLENSGISNGYPGDQMTYERYVGDNIDADFYSYELPVGAREFEIVRTVKSSGALPNSGERYRTSEITATRATIEDKFLRIPTTASGQYQYDGINENYYNAEGWHSYPFNTVVFKVDGSSYATKLVSPGESLSALPDTPSKFGYDFASWQVNGTDISNSALLARTWNSDGEVTARFTAQSTYTVYFEAKPNWKGNGSYVAYAYMWDTNNSKNADYPGVQMVHERYSSTANCDYYSIEVPTGATGLVFARVNKTSGDTGQKTNDIVLNRSTMEGKYAWTFDSASSNIFTVGGWVNYIDGATVTVKVDGTTVQTIDTKGDGTIPAPNTPLKENYLFDYWKYSGGSKINNITSEVFSTNATIEAVWKANTTTLYVEVPYWWENDGYYPYVNIYGSPNFVRAFPGIECTWYTDKDDKKVYSYTFDNTYTKFKLTRAKADGTMERESSEQIIANRGSNNCFYFNNGGSGWYKL